VASADDPTAVHLSCVAGTPLVPMFAAGQEGMFREIGVEVPTRTTVPPKPEAATEESFKAKAQALAPKYNAEFVEPTQETY
jgi:hypothetical protein